MANEIKLDVFTVKLKRKNKDELIMFDDFYKIGEGESAKKAPFSDFFKAYVDSFKGKFFVHEMTGKAISLIPGEVKFNSAAETITGRVEGGSTGLGSKVKARDDNSDDHSFRVAKENVIAMPYYFKLWTPKKSNIGLLLIQSYGSRSISDAFKAHLQRFVSSSPAKAILFLGSVIPKDVQKKIVEQGTVNTITLKRYHLPSTKGEKLLGLKYVANEDITVEVKITGLKQLAGWREKLNEFWTGKVTQLVDFEPLEELGIDETAEMSIKFEHGGKVATAKSSDNYQIYPSYYIDKADLNFDENLHPTLDSMDKYCNTFLEKMKEQIGFVKV